MDNLPGAEDHEKVWTQLADLINQRSLEERLNIRDNLAKYLHDIKHTLGLSITGQELLRRELKGRFEDQEDSELFDTVMEGTRDTNKYLEIIINFLLNNIVDED